MARVRDAAVYARPRGARTTLWRLGRRGEAVEHQRALLRLNRVGIGLGVLSEMLEEQVDEVVGPKGKWNPDRTVRHGHDDGEVTLRGRRVEVRRPRVRTADGAAEVGRW